MSLLDKLSGRLRPTERVLAPVVGELARSMVAEASGGDQPLDDGAIDATAQALCCRMATMPRFLGLPMMGATVFFDIFGVAIAGRPFRFQSPAQRERHLAAWRSVPVSFFGDFLEFHGKMATFSYFSEVAPEHEEGP